MWLRDAIITTAMICLATGCASSNPEAPEAGRVHTAAWVMGHGHEAELDLVVCTTCHNPDFKGSATAASCFTCHDSGPPFNLHPLPYTQPDAHGPAALADLVLCRNCHGTPPNLFTGGIAAAHEGVNKPSGTCSATACHPAAGAHPTNWQGTNDTTGPDYDSSHRRVTAGEVSASCALCHKVTGPGSGPTPNAPSCFSTQFTNSDGSTTGCHTAGPATTPHALPFTSAIAHGVPAKEGLADCQTCHGVPGTTAFVGGIIPSECETCHPAAKAHPTNWQGSNDASADYLSTHRTAKNQDRNCVICHDFTQGRTAPDSGAPSCFSATFTNADGSTTSCHADGAGTANHPLPFSQAQDHGPEAKSRMTDCQGCHGTPNTPLFTGGIASTSCAASACHPAAGAHPTNWQGSNDSSASYLSTHRTALNQNTNCVICHDFTEGRQAPVASAPSCFGASFTNADGSTTSCHANGGGTPNHALPFTQGATHGPTAKANLAACQTCHGTPDTILFNGGVATTSCATAGCHPAASAHPTRWQGTNDNTIDYRSTHRNSGNRSSTCSICHDYVRGRTAPNSGAPSCFASSFRNADGTNTSCH